MRIAFTKMQGCGNDFVVLDETRGRLGLTAGHYRLLGDRHFGVGADQILTVRPSPGAGIDFEYLIHNADGNEVEQCGNGSRCFARFVRERGLTTKDTIRVQTMKGVIAPQLLPDGRVTVNMGAPVFAPAQIPFDTTGLSPVPYGAWQQWPLELGVDWASGMGAQDTEKWAAAVDPQPTTPKSSRPRTVSDSFGPKAPVWVSPVSMGNPHAVLLVDDVDSAPVAALGPAIQACARFGQGVNVGFMQVQDRTRVRLRVFERGVGETLACGTGACAAVVSGMRLGLLDACVDVHTAGGMLTVVWDAAQADGGAAVLMTGPAVTVFQGEIELPDAL